MRGIPILTWHAMAVGGGDYSRNDHAAFREDLETLHGLGLRVVPLRSIAEALQRRALAALEGCVGLSFDDGSDFDFHDLPHPAHGPQRSMANLLADFRARHGAHAQPDLHATSFTIVSPEARRELDRTCMIGCGWWNDDWWRAAEATGLLSVESHSWDHNHDSLAASVARAPRGGFRLDDEADADAEIATASRALAQRRARAGPVLFAYPYGEWSPYLVERYFPLGAARHGVQAAFATGDDPVHEGTSVWTIPRFVFGLHWKRPGELESLLRTVGALPATKRAATDGGAATAVPASAGNWREHLRTWEVNDASVVAGELFRRSFGHPVPAYGRHFVLVYSPPAGAGDAGPAVVAYVHQTAFRDVYLGGGMCVDERAYRRFPKWLFRAVREEGGLATIVTRASLAMLGDAVAAFGHVGEPRARQADLRTGYVDTGRPHLMVVWRKALDDEDKRRILDEVEALGAF